ncbi:GLPGLI family protein [Polaribacter sp. KT25b]|uniref:GLPGLI family protein n=1 Tax=Polaribacter sp. KT25b TaxID=1855336 RepID=UPI00087C7C92|nr:GLPGLI family protein [Polaribacter sp. KT25b]SDS55475.1 GLPGLI family protein [Polaribacter sp. KT25b]
MKIVIVYFFILFSANQFSQSGEIIYEAELLMKEDSSNDSKKAKQNADFEVIMKNQKKVTYKLIFNKNESIFKKEEKLIIDEPKLNLVKILVGNGLFYTNTFLKKTLNKTEFSGKEFLIEVPQFNWKLTQERKKIGNYICYKATTSREIDTRRGKSIRNITAWYTPQIPYNFGPKEYNGLPGLILELQEDSLLFKATKISLLTDKVIEIEKPVKGKKVTQKEYDSIVKNIILQNKRYKQK